jgi:hypothetical protein
VQSALALVFGCALMYVIFVFLAPWNFYFGGHFHAVPGWTGRGWMHSTAAGGDYYLWLRFEPTTPGYRKSPLKGTGFLCTPRGERFRLNFGGNMPRSHGTDLRGVPIHLYLYNWPLLARFVGDRRPRLDLYGSFGNYELAVEDRGSLARAFRPDGTLYPEGNNRPWKQESIRFQLAEDSAWIFSASCPAMPSADSRDPRNRK